jgi:hypothetical protein
VIRVEKFSTPEKKYYSIIQTLYKKNKNFWPLLGILPRILSVGVGSFISMSVYNYNKNKK